MIANFQIKAIYGVPRIVRIKKSLFQFVRGNRTLIISRKIPSVTMIIRQTITLERSNSVINQLPRVNNNRKRGGSSETPSPNYPTSVPKSRSPWNSPFASHHDEQHHAVQIVPLIVTRSFTPKHGNNNNNNHYQTILLPIGKNVLVNRRNPSFFARRAREMITRYTNPKVGGKASGKSRGLDESPKNPRAEACVRAVTVLVLWRVWRYWGSTTTTTTVTTTITLRHHHQQQRQHEQRRTNGGGLLAERRRSTRENSKLERERR